MSTASSARAVRGDRVSGASQLEPGQPGLLLAAGLDSLNLLPADVDCQL